MPEYMESCPKFRPRPFSKMIPSLDAAGLDLLARMLTFDPALRISAADALAHPYFADVAAPKRSLDDDVALIQTAAIHARAAMGARTH